MTIKNECKDDSWLELASSLATLLTWTHQLHYYYYKLEVVLATTTT